MAGATVSPLARFPLFTTFTRPSILAGGIQLGTQPTYITYAPYPDGQGDVTWQGAEFGLSAPTGANVTLIQVSVTLRVSNTTAYPSVTAQLYAGGVPIGSAQALTPSINLITETLTYTGGIPPANLSSLALQVKFHSAAMGLAYVHQAYATANYSFANSVGIITVAGVASVASPVLTVHNPFAYLVAAGSSVLSLTPGFAKHTTAGNLLIAWTFSNSGSSTFDTTYLTTPPGFSSGLPWEVLSGGVPMWYQNNCYAGEAPPAVFSSPATFPMSQLAEFTNARGLDQSGTFPSPSSSNFALTASAQDTKSNDLVIGCLIWGGANMTPVISGASGTDSSGAVLPTGVVTNASTTGQLPAIIYWGQASAPAGPGVDTINGTLNVFDAGGGVIASFFAVQNTPSSGYAASMSSM